jgi:hypothetical protein
LVLSRIVLGLSAFVGVRAISTLLSNEQIEILGELQSLTGIFSMLVLFPLGTFISQKLLSVIDTHRLKSLTASYFLLVIFCISPASVILAFSTSFEVGMAMFLFSTSQCALQFFVPILNLTGNVKSFALHTILYSVLGLVASLIFTYLFNATAWSWVSGQSLAFYVVALLAFRHIVSLFPHQSKRITFYSVFNLQRIVEFSWPLIVLNVANWLVIYSPRIIPNAVNPQGDFASYVILGALSLGLFGVIEVLISQWYGPQLLRKVNGLDVSPDFFRIFEKYWLKCSVFLILSFVAVVVGSETILRLGVDQKFREFSQVFFYFCLIDFLRILSYFSYQIFNLVYSGTYIFWALLMSFIMMAIVLYALYEFQVSAIVDDLLFLIILYQSIFLTNLFLSYLLLKHKHYSVSK